MGIPIYNPNQTWSALRTLKSIRLKRRTGEARDFQKRIFIALKILNLFVILSGQKTLLACLCIPGPVELGEPGGGARGP